MGGAVHPLPNTPSWRGAPLGGAQGQLYLYLLYILIFNFVERRRENDILIRIVASIIRILSAIDFVLLIVRLRLIFTGLT
jgi:hypothetical protein